MKKIIDWNLFSPLLLLCVLATILVLPYTISLTPILAKNLTPIVLILQVIQATVIFAIAIFTGMLLSKKIGWDKKIYKKPQIFEAIGIGVLCGIVIIICSFFFSSLSLSFLKVEMSVTLWKRFLAAFYGGYAEEIVFRFFLLTFFVWISTKVNKKKQPTITGIWIAIIVSTFLFGLGHLGITSRVTEITPIIIVRAIVLNGVGGVFGWLYWKKGLGAAMIAHFSTDIVIHVITPLIATFLM